MVVDPSRDAVVLAEKGARLAQEAGKRFGVVLNKVDGETERALRERLAMEGIEIKGVLPYSPALARASLLGEPLEAGAIREELHRLVCGIRGMVGRM